MCLIAIGIAILCVAGLFSVMHIRENYWDDWTGDEVKETPVAERGDEVKVDYVGKFVDGRIFDTNIENMGRNDSYPKSSTFDSNKQYQELSFIVGAGSMVAGFDEGVMGMEEGQTKSISVPADKGYGEADPLLIYMIPIVDTVPLYESITRAEFDANYSSEIIQAGITTSHHFWGWPVRIVSIDNASVTIENNPAFGENYRGFSWNTTITDISTSKGEINLKHLVGIEVDNPIITPAMYRKYDNSLPMNANDKGVATVENNQIIIDFNREVVGKTLIFEVTLKVLNKAEE